MKTFHRIASIILVVAMAVAALSACSPAPAPTQAVPPTAASAAAEFPITITDDDNRPVTIAAEPKRIVSLVPSMTEILFALGLDEQVVGDTTYCDYPEAAKSKEKVGEFSKIDLEKVVSLSPDLVLATSLHYQTVAPALRERGVTVATLEAQDVEGVLAQIVTIGRLTGRTKEAEALVAGMRGRLDAVAAKVAQAPKPSVFWELDAMLYSVGKGSIVDDMIARAGGDNIGRQLAGEWPQFNMESLVAADPEVIFLADHGFGETAATVAARAGWSGIAAVKQGRIIEVDDINLVSRPGPRVAEAIEYIARALHPDLFK